jgi:hypothetical protein
VEGAFLAAVVLPSATETDALSTGLMVTSCRGLGEIASLRSGLRCFVAERAKGQSIHLAQVGLGDLATANPPA